MKTKINFPLILFIIAVPAIIYIYFLPWKTNTFYGDDLFMFKQISGINSLSEKINMSVGSGKYRPIHGFSAGLIIDWFEKNVNGYYFFNIAIQTLNTFIFAYILNLFLNSFSFALLFSLITGLSRFSFFNITQLVNGGALEGLALTFFLLTLYYTIKTLKDDGPPLEKQKLILNSLLFANLSMYTHERYVVLFPFILLIIFLSPALRIVKSNTRITLTALAVISILLNVLIKKYFFNLPFFVGTGGTNIQVSVSSVSTFLKEAVLSIFQFNSGPDYLVGISFGFLPTFIKILVYILFCVLILILARYLIMIRKGLKEKQAGVKQDFLLFIFFLCLFFFLLAPAIVTIRLEQRWLQASFFVFILLIVIAISRLSIINLQVRKTSFYIVAILFIWIDYTYLDKGGKNLYMSGSEQVVNKFKQAISSGTIRPATQKLYIWEKQRNVNAENGINWILGGGYFFEFYQGNSKKIFFEDSAFEKSYPFAFSSFVNFDPNTQQIVYTNTGKIIDLTSDYLSDSLKEISIRLNDSEPSGRVDYVSISSDDIQNFSTTGFHENEEGIRWTTGNALIELPGKYVLHDTISLTLKTYMPPLCKDIFPKVVLADTNNNEHFAIESGRIKDDFVFKFYLSDTTVVKKINIVSDTINARPSDQRTLSFPFVALEIKNQWH